MSSAKQLVDHGKIRAWADERGARPARVSDTADTSGGGFLRFYFGEPEDGLEAISWAEFFRIFEERALALLKQDETADGDTSRFSRFVRR